MTKEFITKLIKSCLFQEQLGFTIDTPKLFLRLGI